MGCLVYGAPKARMQVLRLTEARQAAVVGLHPHHGNRKKCQSWLDWSLLSCSHAHCGALLRCMRFVWVRRYTSAANHQMNR